VSEPIRSARPNSSLSHFKSVASSYERYRPLTVHDRRRLSLMLERCPLPGRCAVAEVGCGTGKLLRAVVEMVRPVLAVGVDPSHEMLSRAYGLETRLGTAEDLPLGDEGFHLVFFWMAFHHVADKGRAVAQLRRVLQPGGWVAILTATPEHVRSHPLNEYFPSMAGIDVKRMETPERWMRLLVDGGFEWAAEQELRDRRTRTAANLVVAVRARYLSTLALLPEDEFEAGLRRLEAEAESDPARRISHDQGWCLIWTRK
jgi:ubiquinone/menaquinone biosynthesis C-methylase UbiE